MITDALHVVGITERGIHIPPIAGPDTVGLVWDVDLSSGRRICVVVETSGLNAAVMCERGVDPHEVHRAAGELEVHQPSFLDGLQDDWTKVTLTFDARDLDAHLPIPL